MQKKESKTNWHFRLSVFKSCVRFFACFLLAFKDFTGAAIVFSLAEVVGIVEEL